MKIGFGYDLHKLTAGRKMMIGGVHIPCDFGEEAHSDGDVLLHAIIDALLGALAEGDIGSHFPPGDSKWKDVSSLVLLEKTMAIVKEKGYVVNNLDCTVVLEKPKLLPYKKEICSTIAKAIGVQLDCISVKGKTKEKVDAVGRGEAIESFATLLLEKKEDRSS